MNEEQFLIELSRHCFRLARSCENNNSAADFGAIGQMLLNRAHRDCVITSRTCAGAIAPEGESDPCTDCTRPCIAAPQAAKR